MITPQDDKEKEASDETTEQKATDFPDPADHDDDGDDDGDDDDSDNGDHTETADKVQTVPVPPPEKTDHGSEADKKKTCKTINFGFVVNFFTYFDIVISKA